MLNSNNINKLIFGGIYKINDSDLEKYCPNQLDILNDQHYGLWVPVHYQNPDGKDIYYMVDTYQIDTGIFSDVYNPNIQDTYNYLLKGLESLQYPHINGISTVLNTANYYYSALIELTNENIKNFKLYVDLHLYNICDDKEIDYYNNEDLVRHIYLYDGHKYYSKGIALVKKNASINSNKKLRCVIRDIKTMINEPRAANNYNIQKLEDLMEEFNENNMCYDSTIVDKFIKYNNFICKQQKQLEQFKKQLEI